MIRNTSTAFYVIYRRKLRYYLEVHSGAYVSLDEATRFSTQHAAQIVANRGCHRDNYEIHHVHQTLKVTRCSTAGSKK